MNTNNELYFKDCFTEIEEGKINAEFNKATLKCFDSKDNKFSMDCEGNLVVNSIITKQGTDPTSINVDSIYPIGSIYMSVTASDPANMFGGTWEQIKDRFLLSCGDIYENGITGGEATHLLTQQESGLREHTHKLPLSTSIGVGDHTDVPARATYGNVDENFRTGRVTVLSDLEGDYGAGLVDGTPSADAVLAHNNMPPYLTVFMWKRVS